MWRRERVMNGTQQSGYIDLQEFEFSDLHCPMVVYLVVVMVV